jgi:shikimate dehydrogenase
MMGINLTIPYKVAVLQYLDEVATDAQLMGAVNTVWRDGNRLIGENTDGKGFIRSLREDAGYGSSGRNVVIFGAGGAARAISVELALTGASRITVVNRSRKRGEELVTLLNKQTPADATFVSATEPYAIPGNVDIIINATSLGLFPDVDGIPNVDLETINESHLVCDVIPNPPRTPLLRAAEARGARTLDGLGMLVYQGAIAFERWTGQDAPVAVMKQALAAEFGVEL